MNIHSLLSLSVMKKELSKRQNEIIRISLEIIAEKGIQGLTIRNIASKLGVVESAIYRHFKNKIEILYTLLETIKKDSISDNFDKEKNTLTQLEEGLKKRFKVFVSFPALVSVIFSEDIFQNEINLIDKAKNITKNSIDGLVKIIEYGQEKRELRTDIKAEYLALMVIGSLRMFVKQWKMSNYSFDLVLRGNIFIESVKQMLKPIY